MGLILALIAVLFGFVLLPLALLPLEALVLLLLLPGYHLLQLVGVVPWTIVERDGGGVLVRVHRVRGLRAARLYRDDRRAALSGALLSTIQR